MYRVAHKSQQKTRAYDNFVKQYAQAFGKNVQCAGAKDRQTH